MTKIDRNILTIIDPSIKLDPLEMPDAESGKTDIGPMKIKPSKFTGLLIPLVRINTYEIQMDRIVSFNLDCTGFVPKMNITFFDRDGFFQSRFYPKDGDVIQLNIRSQGSETVFKPIRIDFDVTNCYPAGGGGDVVANKFRLEGRMKIPNLYNEFTEFYEDSSFNTLLALAENLELGFASNVNNTNDEMVWINSQDTRENFIRDISRHIYLDDDHFFKVFIDPYYYLTLADINRLYSQEDDIEISKTFSQNPIDVYSDGVGEENFPNVLSNVVQMQGGARYLSKYQLTNNTGKIVEKNGYKKYSTHWDLNEKEIINEFVDPLTTPGTDDMVHLKGRYVGLQGRKVPEGIAQNNSHSVWMGTQDDTVHSEYLYSVVQNELNNKETNKMGMIVDLDTINPAIIRYMRIYCYIVEYADATKDALTDREDDTSTPGRTQRKATPQEDAQAEFIVNEFLSGFYVIKGIEYIYRLPGPLRMRLHLSRREWYPST